MTPKERFLTALNKKQPDRIPLYDYLFSKDLFEEVLGERPDAYDVMLGIDLSFALGHDAVWIPPKGLAPTILDEAGDVYKDEWGTVYKKHDSVSWPSDAPIEYPVKCRDDFEQMTFPDPALHSRYELLKEAVKYAEKKGGLATVGTLLGPFSLAWLLMGPEYLFMAMYDDPGLVDDIYKKYTEYALIGIAKTAECGVDAFIIAEDLGYERGVFYSPDLMRENLFPYIEKMVKKAHAEKLPVILHCDGNINTILDDIVAMGFDALHPLERKCHMDIKKVKEKYGDRLCLFGNIDSCNILAFGTLEEVEEATLECIRDAGSGGGYVLGSDHSLNIGVKIENVMKMYEVHKKHGWYE